MRSNPADLLLVYVDDRYTDFLQANGDFRVSKNINYDYQRPYIGVLFKMDSNEYFAPLTTSSKGKKLRDYPKKENITFYPIKQCQYGGINFNNMIPIVKGVYKEIELKINKNDFGWEINKKLQLINIKRELKGKEKYLISKAINLYSLKNTNRLYANYDAITCDFKCLEIASTYYDRFQKKEISINELRERIYNKQPYYCGKQGKTATKSIRKNIQKEPKTEIKKPKKSGVPPTRA